MNTVTENNTTENNTTENALVSRKALAWCEDSEKFHYHDEENNVFVYGFGQFVATCENGEIKVVYTEDDGCEVEYMSRHLEIEISGMTHII